MVNLTPKIIQSNRGPVIVERLDGMKLSASFFKK